MIKQKIIKINNIILITIKMIVKLNHIMKKVQNPKIVHLQVQILIIILKFQKIKMKYNKSKKN